MTAPSRTMQAAVHRPARRPCCLRYRYPPRPIHNGPHDPVCSRALAIATLTFPAQADAPLTWGVRRKAWARNADVRTARATLEASRFQLRSAYSGYLPQLSASTSYTDINDPRRPHQHAVHCLDLGDPKSVRRFSRPGQGRPGRGHTVAEAGLAAAAARQSRSAQRVRRSQLRAKMFHPDRRIVRRLQKMCGWWNCVTRVGARTKVRICSPRRRSVRRVSNI